MNYLVVGKNGSGKSYFVVTLTKYFYDSNISNLSSNAVVYSKNYELLLDRDQEKLFIEFSQDLEKLKYDNPKVYAPYLTSEDLILDYSLFTKIEDGLDFDDYFRMHLVYKDFINFIKKDSSIKLDYLKPVCCLYSDINGLKIEGVRDPLPDWRLAPLGSKIFLDEFQDRPEFLFDGNRPSKNPMILELSKIRHYDIDLYLITPDPDNLHKSLRKIIHVMYFVKRPHGNPNCCSIYTFDQFLSNPRAAADSKREPKKYASYELLNYKKSIQRLYTSAANHSSMKFQIPWKWIRNAILLIVGISLVLTMFFKIPVFTFFYDAVKGMFGGDNAVAKLKDPFSKPKQVEQQASNQPGQKEDLDCRKAVNVEKPECVQWFNDLSNNKSSVQTDNDNNAVIVAYNPNKPFDLEAVQSAVAYEVTSKPVFSGCMKKGSKYVAYTQQGTKLSSVSNEDCKRLIEDSERPFNYFAKENSGRNDLTSTATQQSEVATQFNQPKSFNAENVAQGGLERKIL